MVSNAADEDDLFVDGLELGCPEDGCGIAVQLLDALGSAGFRSREAA